ncbi:D-aminopeptidase [Lysobacter dokdonensis DS-58]|uniref:D-aminopeptidase n=1 Tax=Lysobacter dokdonensis DS-58 TaxID=1300345 RepID=A0A0A2WIQ8_9GAMM|nr:P1 family peptidase [Lysobacter dokdonensis]KGQ20081.1 D-aminopeptidase [Lysobacter dokdonensis DS-58]
MPTIAVRMFALALFVASAAQAGERARDIGIPFDGTPGARNAITDVAGVTVGQVTLIADAAGDHKVRTGVTAILPRGRGTFDNWVFGGWFALNGNGEMTGTTWISESGQLEGPVLLTNTHSVGVVRDAVIAQRVQAGGADSSGYWWSLPVVAETWDGHLNDINGFHVKPEHVAQALREANDGPVAEGNVGGGTGMICHEFKCGIGTASRTVQQDGRAYTVGVLVQANYGIRDTLRIAGVPVGQQLRNDRVYTDPALAVEGHDVPGGDTGSIIVVVATDAPLLPHQLDRVAKRAGMGLARMGSYAGNGSGDIFVAFSTANADAAKGGAVKEAKFIGNDDLDRLFLATVQATEEAIVNAMIAAKDMRGEGGRYAKAIDHVALVRLLKQYNRYEPAKR